MTHAALPSGLWSVCGREPIGEPVTCGACRRFLEARRRAKEDGHGRFRRALLALLMLSPLLSGVECAPLILVLMRPGCAPGQTYELFDARDGAVLFADPAGLQSAQCILLQDFRASGLYARCVPGEEVVAAVHEPFDGAECFRPVSGT